MEISQCYEHKRDSQKSKNILPEINSYPFQFVGKLKRLQIIQIRKKIQMAWVFKNVSTQKVLDSNGDGNVYAIQENGGSYQKWVVQGNSLRNVATGRILDSNGNGDVYTLPSNGGDYQKWHLEPTHNGTFHLVNFATGRRLDSNGAGNVYGGHANDGNYQRWERLWRSI